MVHFCIYRLQLYLSQYFILTTVNKFFIEFFEQRPPLSFYSKSVLTGRQFLYIYAFITDENIWHKVFASRTFCFEFILSSLAIFNSLVSLCVLKNIKHCCVTWCTISWTVSKVRVDSPVSLHYQPRRNLEIWCSFFK